ncbi:ABC transporter ATP-binding protein [Klenkia taihuensis]|uniref:ATP-binding cassette, subfamily B n=1 Tax=Klenkia taihuensis TaxID=1225127 RepID=A0A1I1SPB2_9ACTN|nr:ABC transporter ATP-binding protein [Klenkia taihuensis]SFD46568.1 ATP-binding cassette, subfamily B [Klenkia taihuensis]
MRRLVGYCLRHRGDLVGAFAAALVGSVIAAGVPLVVREVVDDVVAGGAQSVTPYVWLLVGAGAVRFAAGFTRRYLAGRLSLDVQYDLRNDVAVALSRLDGRGQDRTQTGQVVSRSISDVTLVQGLLAFLPNLAGNALLFVVSIAVMAWLSPLLTLVALAVGPALWWVALRSRRDLFPANWTAQQQAGAVAGDVEAAVTGVRVVKGFGQEGRELDRLDSGARKLFGARMRVVAFSARYNPALQAVPALGQVGVLALGGWLALRGSISLGTFLAFATYLASLVSPVRQLAAVLTIGQQARAGVERVLQIVDTEPGLRSGSRPVPDGPLSLELDDVTFGFGTGTPALSGVSLQVRPGETLALVGTAGSGKSAVVGLLPRFYDVDAGHVRVGGVDVRELDLDGLRGALGVVFEDSFLFSDSVRANIAFGRPDATDAEVRAAARIAQADGFVEELPDGYDTVVGEQGLTLSGGQRQRVALARALLTDPRVLVLDDATSAVDATVEARIQQALQESGPGDRTTLVVAHRASTLALADRVAVLDAGRVVDVGTVDELAERSPLYRLLVSGLDDDVDAGPGAPSDDPGRAPREQDGTDPAAWPRVADGPVADRTLRGATSSIGGRGSAMANMAATPELRELVAALPAADDDPRVPAERARAADPGFTLAGLLRPFRWVLALALVLTAADAAAQIAVPALVRSGIDQGVSAGSLGVLLAISGLALAVVVADWLVTVWATRLTGSTGERLLYTLRVKTFAQLQRLGLDYYERELGGRIMTRMTTDVDALSAFLQTGLTTAVVSLLTLVGVLVALLLLDVELALVLVASLPVLAVATWWFRRRSVPAYTEARERVSAVNARLQEDVAGVRVTQAAVRTQRSLQVFGDRAREYRDVRLRAQRYIATYFPFVEFLSELAVAAVLVVGAQRLDTGTITTGVLVAFLLYVGTFFSPVQSLSQVFDSYQQAAVGLRRLRDLLQTPTSTPPAADPQPVGRLRGEVVLDGVTFAYRGAPKPALHDVTLRIAPGETVALVGETGAGKSTVVKLIARFYDPTGGAVLVDGRDLRDLDLAAYRGRLGVVPQEAHLFDGTVRDAIAYGRPAATDAEVEAAARAVGAHEVVAALPEGYRTRVGERGRSLSAGQRQLLALARAELVDPDVLLLDEATASLDLASEAAVNRAADAVAGRRTTVVVAHRLTTAARADRVVVLDHGRVVQVGPHVELRAVEGPYAVLWRAYAADALVD